MGTEVGAGLHCCTGTSRHTSAGAGPQCCEVTFWHTGRGTVWHLAVIG